MVKFISTNYLKENSNIEMNVDDDKLVGFINRAQDIFLQEILGSTFYFDLMEKIKLNTLNNDEKDLIDNYIQRQVAEWALYLAIPHLNFKLTNKSMSKENSEWSQSSTLSEIKYIRQNVRDMAEFYSERLLKYLKDNSSLYPVYENSSCDENLNKQDSGYFSGFYIRKSRK